MKSALTVARREVRSYFDHPTAYILIIAFLALGLFLAFRTIYVNRLGSLRPLFDLLPWLMALFVPAITMRSLAEERRTRTLEWLMAQPLRESDVIIGKFLGNWIFVLLALAGTLPTAVGILAASEADAGIVFAQYLGAALLAAQGVAIGLWASSVTRNQITAFIVAAMVSIGLVLIGLSIVTMGLPPAVSAVVTQLSVMRHFEGVARGVVDLRDVLYFVSTAALFLVLAWFAVSRERLSRGRGSYKRLRLGTTAVAGAVLVINLLGSQIHGRLDLTRDRLYTLDRATKSLVRELPDLVQVKLFVSDALPPEIQPVLRDVRDLLSDVQRASRGNVRVIERDPEGNNDVATEAQSLGIAPTQFNVVRDDEFQVKSGWLGLAVLYADQQRVIPLVSRSDDLEFQLASFISAMTSKTKPSVAFVTSNGVRGAMEFQALQGALRESHELRFVDLVNDSLPLTPESARVVFIAAPTEAFAPASLDRLERYFDLGGSALLLAENAQINPQYPQAMPTPNVLEQVLAKRGIQLKPGMVFDLRAHNNVMMGRQGPFGVVSGYPLWPVTRRASAHATTRNLEQLSLGWASSLEIHDTANVQPLWVTTSDAGVRGLELPIVPSMLSFTPSDVKGPQIVAAAYDPGARANGNTAKATQPRDSATQARARFVVVGDADFLTDRFAQDNPQNLVFAANALDWLGQDERLIRIRSKLRTPPALVFTSDVGSAALKWGNLIGVPLLFAAVGAVRITRRQQRARRHWAASTAAPSTP